MATPNTGIEKRPPTTAALTKQMLSTPAYRSRFEEILGQRAPQFMASVVSAAASPELQGCDPQILIGECLKAAVLDFPIEKSIGYAFIVPYRKNNKPVPQFQLGWKGVVQLALRTGMYDRLNARMVNAAAYLGEDEIGEPIIDWKNIDESQEPAGFAVVWKLKTGFVKVAYWTKEKCMAHARKYSKAYQYDLRDHKTTSLWSTNPNPMCLKTVIMNELRRWGLLSVEMRRAFDTDSDDGRVDLSDEGVENGAPTVDLTPISEEQRTALFKLKEDSRCPNEKLEEILSRFGFSISAEVTQGEYEDVCQAIRTWDKGAAQGTNGDSEPSGNGAPRAQAGAGEAGGESDEPNGAESSSDAPEDEPKLSGPVGDDLVARQRSGLADAYEALAQAKGQSVAKDTLELAAATRVLGKVKPEKLGDAIVALNKRRMEK